MQGARRPWRLAAADLACRRGDRVLFAGVHFALEPGDALHLAGPNGIGKSSLIRILAGLLRPYAGRVERSGAIALADDHLPLDGQAPLARALDFWAGFDGIAHDALEAAVLRLEIELLLDVPVRYLSTGQKKRALLALTAARGVPIWLLDEPLNGLDTQGLAIVETLIEEHRAEGGIAVIASHLPLGLPDIQRAMLADHVPGPEA